MVGAMQTGERLDPVSIDSICVEMCISSDTSKFNYPEQLERNVYKAVLLLSFAGDNFEKSVEIS